MRTWRPNGWETLKAKNHPLHCFFPDACVGESFEAGADAIVKFLRESARGHYVRQGDCFMLQVAETPGTWVFIPDDNEGKTPSTG